MFSSATRQFYIQRRHTGTNYISAVVRVSSERRVPADSAHLAVCPLAAVSGTGRLSLPLLSTSPVLSGAR